MTSNPYQGPETGEKASPEENKPSVPTGREAYNVVTDVVTGPNLRWKDNFFQAIAIVVCTGAGIFLGWFFADDKPLGVMAGGGAGLLVGLFGSGTILMVWRGLRHLRGRHD